MTTATDIRNNARKNLKNKWGKGALITLCYIFIEFILNYLTTATEKNVTLNLIVLIISIIISTPISYGIIIAFMKLKRNEEVKAFDFLKYGFENFSKSWKLFFSMLYKLLLPIILLALSYIILTVGLSLCVYSSALYSISSTTINYSTSIIILVIGLLALFASSIYLCVKQLSLALTYYIAYDEPNLPTKLAVAKSRTIMNGQKGNYFVLLLSFIGWAILSVFTLGIGSLFLIPYIQVSSICFYDLLKTNNK